MTSGVDVNQLMLLPVRYRYTMGYLKSCVTVTSGGARGAP
jgi:hypothetical protein